MKVARKCYRKSGKYSQRQLVWNSVYYVKAANMLGRQVWFAATLDDCSSQTALRLVSGVPLETLDVGDYVSIQTKLPITRSINVVDTKMLKPFLATEKRSQATAQMVPNDPVEDFMGLLE